MDEILTYDGSKFSLALVEEVLEKLIEKEMFDEMELMSKSKFTFKYNLCISLMNALFAGRGKQKVSCSTKQERRIVHAVAEAYGLYHGRWFGESDWIELVFGSDLTKRETAELFDLHDHRILGVWISRTYKKTTIKDRNHQNNAIFRLEKQKAERRAKRREIGLELVAWYWSPEGPGYKEAEQSFASLGHDHPW